MKIIASLCAVVLLATMTAVGNAEETQERLTARKVHRCVLRNQVCRSRKRWRCGWQEPVLSLQERWTSPGHGFYSLVG